MKRLLIITDAWIPQVNGVVRTLQSTIKNLENDFEVKVISPNDFKGFCLPGYKEIKISIPFGISKMIEDFDPHSIHIATEGPLGWASRKWCIRNKYQFTTSYHTQFPEYIRAKYFIPAFLTYPILRKFHNAAFNVMVNTNEMKKRLDSKGFTNLCIWSRGVDTELFKPEGEFHPAMKDLYGPILLNVGRVSIEKNLPEFYELNHIGTKVQVGSGPELELYKKEYKDVVFLGEMHGEELASAYRSADVFVFPSQSDTFGLVMLESMASGVPVAAYPVTGPIDVVENGGYLSHNLAYALNQCFDLTLNPIENAKKFSWKTCTKQFFNNLFIYENTNDRFN